MKTSKVFLMIFARLANYFVFAAAFFTSPEHDCGAVSVVGTHINTVVPTEFLKADPDIGLDIFDQVPQMDGAVGVGQGTGDEDFTLVHAWWDAKSKVAVR